MPHPLLHTYTPPSWMSITDGDFCAAKPPSHRVTIANLPTPVEDFPLPNIPEGVKVRVKRDDMTGGIELTGNKVRKLEFLLADAMKKHAEVIVTTGGTQSNHARATVAACRKLGLRAVLGLRDDGHGTNGNFVLEKILGAEQHVIPKDQWAQRGGHPGVLTQLAREYPGKAYAIPCGGTNSLGAWGYIQCVEEMRVQEALNGVSDVVCASGSGGTVAGLGIGLRALTASQQSSKINLTSYCVCDTPVEFYDIFDDIATQVLSNCRYKATDLVTMKQATGLGYSKATIEELQFMNRVARETGIVFDRCYTNKALYGMVKDLQTGGLQPTGTVLFLHTGGGPSVFDEHESNCPSA
jgi:D-cysteine desulfhydrase